MKPILRKKNLATAELSGETVIYDLDRHRAYCLDGTASAVWRFCEGACNPGVIARRLRRKMGWTADEALVERALDQLQVAGLIEGAALARALRIRSRAARQPSLVSSIVVPTSARTQCRGA
jgi:hypothetical protein